MKKLFDFNKILKDVGLDTKIFIYLALKTAADDFDSYEANYTLSNLPPITIHGHVRSITPEALVWKQYGLHQNGAVEVITQSKHRTLFENANKITINNIEYQVFKEGTGNRSIMQDRPLDMLRVILTRAG